MTNRITKIANLLIIGLFIFVIEACLPTQTQAISTKVNPAETAVYSTAFAQLTSSAILEETSLPLDEIVDQTFTLTPEFIEQTVAFTPTKRENKQPTPTAIVVKTCGKVELVGELSIAPDTELFGGEAFKKTWRLRNLGDCSWNGEYKLIYLDGEKMSSELEIPLNTTVEPGEVIDLSVQLVAPEEPGNYSSRWMLMSDQGGTFGPINDEEEVLRVDITVINTPYRTNSKETYSFIDGFCSADWRGNNGISLCAAPGNEYQFGSVFRVLTPILEGGNEENEPVLITIPADGTAGVINGVYPPIKVVKGDSFYTLIGCMEGNPLCDVTFEFGYINENGEVTNLGSWTEIQDGIFQKVSVNLNSLAGKTVRFVLTVKNNGISREDQAFWLVPSIRN